MFVIANFVGAIATLLNLVLQFMLIVIFIRAIISWVNPDPYNPIVQTLHRLTEPVLSTIRSLLPFCYMGGIDLSPFIACLLIIFLQSFAVVSLHQLAATLR